MGSETDGHYLALGQRGRPSNYWPGGRPRPCPIFGPLASCFLAAQGLSLASGVSSITISTRCCPRPHSPSTFRTSQEPGREKHEDDIVRHFGYVVTPLLLALINAGCSGLISPADNSGPVAPAITTQPTSQTVAAGQTATFAVAAVGPAPLSYQWRKNGGRPRGPTPPTITTPPPPSSDAGAPSMAWTAHP